MKYCGVLIAVSDIEESKAFYTQLLNLKVVADYGANVSLSGGIFLQSIETWKKFINKNVSLEGNDAEFYFEEDELDDFVKKADRFNLQYVHTIKKHPWGQRAIRFYDPDMHIIEVGESIGFVVHTLHKSGLNKNQIATKMDISIKSIERYLK